MLPLFLTGSWDDLLEVEFINIEPGPLINSYIYVWQRYHYGLTKMYFLLFSQGT
jgi:hypothetical protein